MVGWRPDLADADTILLGEASADFAGRAVSPGDLDGDGQDDLVLSAYFADRGLYAQGAAYAMAGPFSGVYNMGDGATFLGGTSGLYAGMIVAGAGDIDGDGLQDLLVGGPLGGAIGEGEAYLLHGAPIAP